MPASTDPRLPYREIAEEFLPARDPVLGYVKVGGKNQEIRYTRAGKPWVTPTRLLDPARFEITTREKITQRVKGRGDKSNEEFTVDLGYKRDAGFHDLEGVGPAPSSLRIRLMYPTWQQNLIAFLGAYGGGQWVCRGNGVEATDARTGERVCPCPRLTQFAGDYAGPHPNDGARWKDGAKWRTDGFFPCKPHAQLHMILEDAGTFGGFWALKTTSFETISNLTKSMQMFQEMFERIDGLPLELRVQAVTKQLPGGGTTTQPIVTLVLASSMNTARQVAADAAAESRKFLPAGGPIEESVYRDAVVAEMEDEAESTAGEFSTPIEEMETLTATEEPDDGDEGGPSVDAEPKSGDPDEPTGAGTEEEGEPSHVPDEVDGATRDDDPDPDGFEEPASAHRTPAAPPAPTTPNPAGDSDRNEKDAALARQVLAAMGWKPDAVESRLEHHIQQRNLGEMLARLEKHFPEAWASVAQKEAFTEPDDGLPS